MKIIFYINYPTPYQIEFFDEINKICDLKVIFLNKKLKNYNFIFSNRKYVFFVKNNYNFITNTIKKFKPNFLILGGYKLKYTKTILGLCTKNNYKYLFWLEKIEFKNIVKKIILKNYFKYLLKKCYGILAVGNEAKDFYLRYNKNTINFHYSIKISKIKKKKYFMNKKINFLYVGQLIERKNIINLIKAFQKLSNNKTTLTIVGNGDLKKKVELMSLSNKNIKISKFLNKNLLKKYFINSDVFILPSKYDGWGVVVMEAMSFRCAVICTNSSGISLEYIKNNFNGKVSGFKINELHESLKYYCDNKSLIKKHAERSRLKVLNSSINSKHAAKKLINFFKKK